MSAGGLENFDADAAAARLAAVGQAPAPVAPPVPAVPDAGTNVPLAAPNVAEPQVTQSGNSGQPSEVPAPAAPVDVMAVPPPAAPAPTGDLMKDVEANRLHQQALHEHYTRREQELLKRAHGEAVKTAAANVAVAEAQRKEQQKIAAQRAAMMKAAQDQIDGAVQERAAAHQDLEGATWMDKHAGAALVATIFGGVAAAMQNAAAAQLGQVGHAQNEAVATINGIMDREYAKRRARLQDASAALLEARHGFKDARENALAAQNDLDADFAARWKLVGAEAERRLRQAGASDADIKANGIVAEADQKAAQLQGSILDREMQRQEQAEAHKATLAMAGARFDQAERQIEATTADRRANRYERRREFDERRADKKAAADEKADLTAVRAGDNDPTGLPKGTIVGHVPTGRGGAQGFATRDADYARAADQIQALIDHVKAKGTRPLSPSDISDRETVYNNALGGVVTVSPMGKTNEAQHVEKESIGPSGGLSLRGANLPALERKLHELRKQREEYRSQTLIPVEGGGKPAKGAEGKATPKGASGGSKYQFLQDLLDEAE